MKDVRTSEVEKALNEVRLSDKQLDYAFDQLRAKIDAGTRRVENALHRAQAPVRFVRRQPLALLPVLFIGGYYFGRLIRDSFTESQERPTLTGPSPLPPRFY